MPAIYDGGYFRHGARSEADGYADYLREELEHRLIARRRAGWLGRLVSPKPLASPGLPASQERLASRGRLLDVGAAAGFFMDEARKTGWHVQGIDVSPEMTCEASKRLGLEIVTGIFQHATYAPATFDAVTMWDYIEHSIDPASDLTKAAEILRPGGILMLSTGDAGSAVARISGRNWHLLTPRHHNFFFTRETLRRYLQARNFELIYVGYPGAYYSLRYLFYKLQTIAPRNRVLRVLSDRASVSAAGERALYFNLRDIVTIHARRL